MYKLIYLTINRNKWGKNDTFVVFFLSSGAVQCVVMQTQYIYLPTDGTDGTFQFLPLVTVNLKPHKNELECSPAQGPLKPVRTGLRGEDVRFFRNCADINTSGMGLYN